MEAQHTPGPWVAEIEPTGLRGVNVRFTIRGGGKHSITSGQSQEHLGDGVGIHEAECVANARLIKAAPELFDALARLLEQCGRLRLANQMPTSAELYAAGVLLKVTGITAAEAA